MSNVQLFGPWLAAADQDFHGSQAVRVNAMSTRIRRVGAVGEGESGSMLVVVGEEKT